MLCCPLLLTSWLLTAKPCSAAVDAVLCYPLLLTDWLLSGANCQLCRREEHKQTGQMCEHGVWRCRICFPHETK